MSKNLKGANKITGKKLYGISKEDIISDVTTVYEKSNGKLTREEYLKKGSYSRAPIRRLFGGWNALLKELDFNINCSRMDATKEEVLLDAKRLIKEHGKLTAKLYRKDGKYSQAVVDRLFGSHGKLMRELGLYSGKAGRNVDKEEIIQGLKELYLEHGFINAMLIDREFYISLPTVYKKVGHINDIYKIMGIQPVNFSRSSSKVISIIASILEEMPIKEWTYPQLRNPKTGCSLYIDAYFPKHNLAVEYDGEQHFSYTPFFYKNEEEFLYRKKLDKLKNEILYKDNISLIRIRFDEPKTREHLKNLLKIVSNKKA